MTQHDTALVWFRRDLRLHDNPALNYAAEHARAIVPVFVFAPDEEGEWAPGAASRWWLHHSLLALDQSLRDRGLRLIVRAGSSRDTLRALLNETQATLLCWSRVGEPQVLARDQSIVQSVSDDVEIATHNANALFEPGSIRNAQGGPYKVFTAFWRAAEARLRAVSNPIAPPKLTRPTKLPPSAPIESLELLPRIRWDRGLESTWKPGEEGALERLREFSNDVRGYAESRNRPDEAGTSRLSAHLHFGEIGPRQVLAVLHATAARGPSMETFERELGWREFAMHLLQAFPETPTRPLDRSFERMAWACKRSTLAAWQRGETGHPIVDAGMRELWYTGWMHNRVRMIVASFLTKNLQQHWLHGARWFWDTLVDADLANNTLGWQWTAGCGADAAPYYRIFNPVLQSERFDPERRYLRRWLPELRRLPDRWIHRPWQAPPSVLNEANVNLGKNYPRPIVDLQLSRDAAMRAYREMRPAR